MAVRAPLPEQMACGGSAAAERDLTGSSLRPPL